MSGTLKTILKQGAKSMTSNKNLPEKMMNSYKNHQIFCDSYNSNSEIYYNS